MLFKLQRPTQLTAILLDRRFYTPFRFFPTAKCAQLERRQDIHGSAMLGRGNGGFADIGFGYCDHERFRVKCVQRFLLLFSLILVFEINDLKNDDPNLKTVPQQIGVKRTKILGVGLLAVFYFLEFLKRDFETRQLLVNAIIVPILAFCFIFLVKAATNITRPFMQRVPILWWLLVVVSGCV
jgi:hypothetical protein